MKYFAWILLAAGPLLWSLPGFGAVLRVEKDGSGDFTVIQDAIDAAEDGDTIEIGPGRYNDFITEEPWGNFWAWVHGDKSLHFLGSGAEETIIGPEEWGGGYRDWGLFCEPGSAFISVEGIRFENFDRIALTSYADDFRIENCVFQHCRVSCAPYGGLSSSIRFCEFYDGPESYAISCRTEETLISNILVENCFQGIYCQASGGSDVLIQDSVFEGGGTSWSSVYLVYCSARVQGCHISNIHSVGIDLTETENVILEDNIIEGIRNLDGFQGAGVGFDRGTSLTMTGNIISSSDNCVYINRSIDNVEIHGNHFLRDPGSEDLYIRVRDDWAYFEEHVDFSENYWGTTDADEISQWIFDGHDSDAVTMYIDFLPLADGPVATESTTLDAVKALYRGTPE